VCSKTRELKAASISVFFAPEIVMAIEIGWSEVLTNLWMFAPALAITWETNATELGCSFSALR
jgi:hypothetical protein